MIAEFALTPWVFDQTAHHNSTEDWRIWLSTLAHRMFPQRNLCPVLVTDLSGLWTEAARKFVDQISDHRAKGYAQRLFAQIGARLVRRQLAPGAVNPAREDWWAQAGCRASTVELIDRLIATAGCHATLTGTLSALRSLADVEDDRFWQDISVEWSPLATVPAQVATLRKLSLHGEFVWLATPYATGARHDETPFACAMIRDVFRRPRGFDPPVEVELHTQRPHVGTVAEHLDAVCEAVLPYLPKAQTVRHVVWEKLLERIALAGVFTTTSTGRKHAPRWGVHMGHIARKHEAQSGATHEWKQLNDDRVGYWFGQFGSRGHNNFVTSEEIRR
ncbi:hypothetical protein R5W23_003402 [Gemmata sp. JC673]|uniref:Uncharacterized protein n=1 Tax=Gemmata algarum TaxID=2975278 RepID=A0ABU5F7Y1_9BACT|nr:hypothetical protein [Gemmata algarum]MDY3561971.1 hypothetical protein [Gemmata algarum]